MRRKLFSSQKDLWKPEKNFVNLTISTLWGRERRNVNPNYLRDSSSTVTASHVLRIGLHLTRMMSLKSIMSIFVVPSVLLDLELGCGGRRISRKSNWPPQINSNVPHVDGNTQRRSWRRSWAVIKNLWQSHQNSLTMVHLWSPSNLWRKQVNFFNIISFHPPNNKLSVKSFWKKPLITVSGMRNNLSFILVWSTFFLLIIVILLVFVSWPDFM